MDLGNVALASAETEDADEEEGAAPYTPQVTVEVTVADREGYRAVVDTGASHTFIHPSVVQSLGLQILRYKYARNFKLGTKGSRAKVNAFCYAKFSCARVTKTQRFELANIEEDLLVGRDFLRTHKVVVELEPDSVFAREIQGVLVADDAPLSLPPVREVEHTIPLINNERKYSKKVNYEFPDHMREAFQRSYDAYIRAGIWETGSAEYADPMIPKLKSNGEHRPIVDLCLRNESTIQLQMPVSDQDEIVNAVAAANFCTKIDLQGAFQQIRIKDEDLKKTAFSTLNGILYSRVAQRGDRNSTVTLHRLVSYAFAGLINRKINHYADDLWPISDTWAEHKRDVRETLERSHVHGIRIPISKFKFATDIRDSLGRRIRPGEMSMQPEKTAGIRATPVPQNKKELQRCLRAVEYNHRFIPRLAELAAPLNELTAAVDDNAKLTCIRSNELAPIGTRPVHPSSSPAEGETAPENESKGKYLFLQIDAPVTGVGCVLTIGTNWWTTIPVGYHSRKFSPAQFNYNTQDQELQGMYERIKLFESKLRRRPFIVLTAKKALAQFTTLPTLSRRQTRMYLYFSEFAYTIEHIKGEHNVMPDMLSRAPCDAPTHADPESETDETAPQTIAAMELNETNLKERPSRTR
ncbi:BQ2448_2367 [Microbotryum intermedium]|uniref:RNA-directed DNA polymerase n=1 Tax=Microbotryum intermedium TaxID=269621 RepID=A0A238F876_9BASI|nr:BQ2448_2367 [Microbotryum intermedium]